MLIHDNNRHKMTIEISKSVFYVNVMKIRTKYIQIQNK